MGLLFVYSGAVFDYLTITFRILYLTRYCQGNMKSAEDYACDLSCPSGSEGTRKNAS